MPDYARDLSDLAALVVRDADIADVLGQALASLREVVPYDLAAVFRLRDDALHVLAAAGPLDGPSIRRHRLQLSRFPTIRRALSTRRPIPLEAHDHAGDEGDPFDGVLDLPHGHSCMVVPLYAGDRNLGLITLDRTTCAVYSDDAVRLAGLYGQLVSMALRFADQAALLDRYRHQLQAENRRLRDEAGGGAEACRRVEASQAPAMIGLARLARQVAESDLPVLLHGQTGSGKEVLAHAIHHWSPRADGPLVALNCAALPENLVESELFGHVKGAFTGALRDRPGAFRTANGGTLLLDEIGELPAAVQAKLLRVLQEGTFQPVGRDEPDRVDVRVIAATHVDLARAVEQGRFREDLYYRLAVFPLRLPPLRARADDILPIARDLLEGWARDRRRGPWTLSPAAEAALRAAPWPGNVRELRNALERATILQPAGPIAPEHLGLGEPDPPKPAADPRPTAAPATGPLPTADEAERDYLLRVLAACGGKVAGPGGAAEVAGVPPSTLRSRMLRLGVR
jgi:transcriptional regulator with GAF, ATPase, and Fis domain